MRENKKLDIILEQCEKAFSAQTERGKRLTDKADKYVAAIGLIIGFQLLNLKKINFSEANIEIVSVIASILGFVGLVISIILAFISTTKLNYSSYPNKRCQWNTKVFDENLVEDTVKYNLSDMYIEASISNASINNRRSCELKWSGGFLIGGFILVSIGYILSKMFL